MGKTALCLTLLLSGVVHAEDVQLVKLRDMSLDDVLAVDISTGTSKFLHQAPAVAYVITRDDIARMGARNLLDVINSIPGLNANLFQAGTNAPLVDMRGLLGQLLFLRDGKRLRVHQVTIPEVFRLPVQFIERIEIMRGAAVTTFGIDALNGVVNIITSKQPNEVGGALGSSDHRRAWLGRHGVIGAMDWSAAVTYARNVDPVHTRFQAGASLLYYTQQFSHEFADIDLKFRSGPWSASFWTLQYAKAEQNDPFNPRGGAKIDTRHRHLDAIYADDLSAATRVQAHVGATTFGARRGNELVPGGGIFDDQIGERRQFADFTLTTTFPSHRLRFNAGFEKSRFYLQPAPEAGPAPPDLIRNTRYVAIQDEYAIAPDWELTAGLRADHLSDFGSLRNPRLALVWNVNPQLTTKLIRGNALRAPKIGSIAALTKRPEHMHNTEWAVDYRPNERVHILGNVYRFRARDIVENPADNASPTPGRVGNGAELELGWLLQPQTRLDAAFSYINATNTDGSRAAYTPKFSTKLALTWQPTTNWTLNARWERYTDWVRDPSDTRPPLHGFQALSLTAQYRIDAQTSLRLAGHNLGNSQVYLPVVAGPPQDYQIPERNLALEIEHRF